jgi:hypothetical protein
MVPQAVAGVAQRAATRMHRAAPGHPSFGVLMPIGRPLVSAGSGAERLA